MGNQKKIIILLTVLSVIMIIFSKSYALFQTTIVSDKSVVEIKAADNWDQGHANSPELIGNMLPVYYDDLNKEYKKADKLNVTKKNKW